MNRKAVFILVFLVVGLFAVVPTLPPVSAAPIALDGNSSNNCTTQITCSTSLTTTSAYDIIVVTVFTFDKTSMNAKHVTSLTASGLTFSLRKNCICDFSDVEEWYAVAGAAPLSGLSITATISGSTNAFSISAFGVSGADLINTFDTNAALPSCDCPPVGPDPGTTPLVSVTTSNANDFIFATAIADYCGGGAMSVNAPLTLINAPHNAGSGGAGLDGIEGYDIVTTTKSGLSLTFTTTCSAGWDTIGDAIQQRVTVTQPIKVTVANSGTVGTGTVSGCAVSPTTIAFDGTVYSFTPNRSCTVTVTVPADGASTRYRFSGGTTTTVAVCASGNCGSSSLTVYYELLVTNIAAFTLTYTLGGASAPTTTGNTYVDYATSLNIMGQYNNTISSVTVPLFLYQVLDNGIQIYGDQSLNSIAYTSSNPDAPFLSFVSAISCHCQGFIPPITALTLQNVYNNGVVNMAATFSGNTIDETGISPHEWDLTMLAPSIPSPSPSPSPAPAPVDASAAGGGGASPPPLFQIQITSTTATILGQPVILYVPTYGNPGLISLGVTVLAVALIIVFLGFAFIGHRNRRKEYKYERHF